MTKLPYNPACPLYQRANPEPMPLRDHGRSMVRLVGVALVLAALAATAWARTQDSDVSPGRIVLACVVLVAIALGVSLVGKEGK